MGSLEVHGLSLLAIEQLAALVFTLGAWLVVASIDSSLWHIVNEATLVGVGSLLSTVVDDLIFILVASALSASKASDTAEDIQLHKQERVSQSVNRSINKPLW